VKTFEAVQSLVTVHSCKYDGSIKRSWRARLARLEGSLIVLEGAFEEEVRHPLLGTIVEGTLSTEFFWTNRWYSVFRFREPSGALRNFYGNLNTPPRLENGVLSFKDLDIDVLVAPDFTYRILDEEEFEEHSAQFGYSPEFRRKAFQALAELLAHIERREFPFDAETFNSSLLNSALGPIEERNHFE
jgi:protein associated with RNAse G/E